MALNVMYERNSAVGGLGLVRPVPTPDGGRVTSAATAVVGRVEVWRGGCRSNKSAVGRTYLLPPLSSGGASLVRL